jgi:hypothetical protein
MGERVPQISQGSAAVVLEHAGERSHGLCREIVRSPFHLAPRLETANPCQEAGDNADIYPNSTKSVRSGQGLT